MSQRPVLLVALLRAGGAAKEIIGHSTALNRSNDEFPLAWAFGAAGAVGQVPAADAVATPRGRWFVAISSQDL